jgi:16S rRNA processing protein RimM
MDGRGEDWVRIGGVRRSWGRRGELLIRVETDWPELRFAPGRQVWLARPGMAPRGMTVEGWQDAGPGLRLKLEGLEDIGEASEWVSATVLVPVAGLEVPEGELSRAALEGLRVVDLQGQQLGRVEAVDDGVAADLLRVRTVDGDEVLVPLARALCPEIDLQEGKIVVDPPEGLFDLEQADVADGEEGRS